MKKLKILETDNEYSICVLESGKQVQFKNIDTVILPSEMCVRPKANLELFYKSDISDDQFESFKKEFYLHPDLVEPSKMFAKNILLFNPVVNKQNIPRVTTEEFLDGVAQPENSCPFIDEIKGELSAIKRRMRNLSSTSRGNFSCNSESCDNCDGEMIISNLVNYSSEISSLAEEYADNADNAADEFEKLRKVNSSLRNEISRFKYFIWDSIDNYFQDRQVDNDFEVKRQKFIKLIREIIDSRTSVREPSSDSNIFTFNSFSKHGIPTLKIPSCNCRSYKELYDLDSNLASIESDFKFYVGENNSITNFERPSEIYNELIDWFYEIESFSKNLFTQSSRIPTPEEAYEEFMNNYREYIAS